MTRTSLIMRIGVDTLFTSVIAFSVFLLFAGHNAPGGGFVGGLVAAAGLVLRFLAEGSGEVRRSTRAGAPVFLGAGLLVAVASGTAALLAGDALLHSYAFSTHVPLLGTVKASTTLLFDIGVYLVVVGFVLVLVDVLGDRS